MHYYDRITPDRERILSYERHPRLGFMTSAPNFLTYDQAQSGYTMVAGTGRAGAAGADTAGAGRATGSSGGVFRTGGGTPGAGSSSGGGGGGDGGVKVGGTTIFGGTGHKLGTSAGGGAGVGGSSSVQMQPVPMHVVQLPHRDTPNANPGGEDSNV
eukprot:TRINITY_DN602_c0_g1_i13.p1 TRINITY_DN602_c0_g1~~TRINITY_DN602_c0_g1_i13.p1  ORF type:complete len:156 (+),score=40.94 TRINITY_DN602_c0_g1_i13:86-553(+)